MRNIRAQTTRVRVLYDGTDAMKYGYFDGKRLLFAGIPCSSDDLAKAKGVVHTQNKTVAEKIRAAGYQVEILKSPQVKWHNANLWRLTLTFRIEEKAALMAYCERRGMTLYNATREIIREALRREQEQAESNDT